MPETVVGSAIQPQVPRLGAAAEREGNDVVELQQEAGPATPLPVSVRAGGVRQVPGRPRVYSYSAGIWTAQLCPPSTTSEVPVT